jgi:hypothetical protein
MAKFYGAETRWAFGAIWPPAEIARDLAVQRLVDATSQKQSFLMDQ